MRAIKIASPRIDPIAIPAIAPVLIRLAFSSFVTGLLVEDAVGELVGVLKVTDGVMEGRITPAHRDSASAL